MRNAKKLPITVGIIGHLDAVMTAEHRRIIQKFFDDLSQVYPNSPVCLFSQLAEGADTMVAELFLEIKAQTTRPYELVVPLPYAAAQYRMEIAPARREQFDRLSAQASRLFTLTATYDQPLENLYRYGGQFVADSSVLLLALWDMETNEKVGGTHDIVRYKESGTFRDMDVDQIFEQKGHLMSLYCRRTSNPSDAASDVLESDLLDCFQKDSGIRKALEKIEQMNTATQKAQQADDLRPGCHLVPADENLDSHGQVLQSLFTVTDQMAITNQKFYNWILGGLFIMGFLIIGLFESYKHLDASISMLAGTLVLIGVAFVISQISHHRQHHHKFLENRILAEAIRIQFFWFLGGVQRNVVQYILRIHKEEFAWIKHILFAIYGLSLQQEVVTTRPEVIQEYWLKSELAYFTRKHAKISRLTNTLNRIAMTAFGAAFLLMLSMLFWTEHYHAQHLWHPLIVGIGCLLGVFALCKAYIEKKGFHQTLNQYRLMQQIYDKSIQKIQQLELQKESEDEVLKKRNRLYYLTGKEALIEIGNWYLIYKDKELEVQGVGG